MDRDFDGRLSFAEMMGEETAVETLFKKMDKNGDGFVSKKVVFNLTLLFLDKSYLFPGISEHLQEVEQRAGTKVIQNIGV